MMKVVIILVILLVIGFRAY
ncbi:type I toxin-antitoxin system Ibs family toxin [Salmonella enterica subsp. enterica]|nr:type I toxin-antitoxin system Ibs family toxin [Salmonella enterica subsp. enterica]